MMPNTAILMTETYAFSAAHHLPTFPEGHKCRRVHGHTWKVKLTVTVIVGEDGYAFDHADLNGVAATVLAKLDHQLINDVTGLERGLAEDILIWLVDRFLLHLPTDAELTSLSLIESSSSSDFRPTEHVKTWRRPAPVWCISSNRGVA